MARKWIRLAGAMALAFPVAAQAQQAASTAPGYTMPQTAAFDMKAANGQIYRIFVSFPKAAPPEGGYPVLYVLDGNALFASFAETRRMMEWSPGDKAIVVGVGYPTDEAYDVRRIDDFTGAPTTSGAYAKFAREKSGGWDRFLDFLTGELRTEIGRRYKTNPDRQSLFGHSLGGLFALHTLYTRPGAFHAIIAASPSIFWHEALTLKEERDFAARLQAGTVPKVSRLLVVTGDREEAILERWDAEDFVQRTAPLSAYGLRTRSEIFAGEGHMTVPVRAVPATLRFSVNWP
ncbi:alpha/beta hydrolase-fold protein [Sphingomonas sp. BT-65]|uniref:alpha/beta hydrolase n=1 Tax=Sphingomonas sp. BT-65 TaxID=2989821 RepID=UPI0022368C25|nr:alpha/beta hydrolase-fold protein [Sphingomonas sp. BT-65]MCW4460690.1 alpha/beta hydrolase-fold protein [Sphingomonas sp. BT-65]